MSGRTGQLLKVNKQWLEAIEKNPDQHDPSNRNRKNFRRHSHRTRQRRPHSTRIMCPRPKRCRPQKMPP